MKAPNHHYLVDFISVEPNRFLYWNKVILLETTFSVPINVKHTRVYIYTYTLKQGERKIQNIFSSTPLLSPIAMYRVRSVVIYRIKYIFIIYLDK